MSAIRPRPSKWLLLVPALVMALIFLYLAFINSHRIDHQPADFSIEGSTLIILNRYGEELWQKRIPTEPLQSESFYRERAQLPARSEKGPLYAFAIKDFNGDGLNEVMIAAKGPDDQIGEGYLYWWDAKGEREWRFPAGREMKFGSMVYSPDYRIHGFLTHDINDDGLLETIVISYQAPQWPCQLAVLDSAGHQLDEYWNSGYLVSLGLHDINGDSHEELLACGANNEYGACLIVFDPLKISGSSPQTGEYRAQDLPVGSQLAYVTFPRTDVSLALRQVAEGATRLEILKNDRIRVTLDAGIWFELDFGLRCVSVDWGHKFILYHTDLKTAAKITSTLGDGYRRTVSDGIRYWAGQDWTTRPVLLTKFASASN